MKRVGRKLQDKINKHIRHPFLETLSTGDLKQVTNAANELMYIIRELQIDLEFLESKAQVLRGIARKGHSGTLKSIMTGTDEIHEAEEKEK